MRAWLKYIPIGLIISLSITTYRLFQVSDAEKDSTTRSEDGEVIEAGKVGFNLVKIGDCTLYPNGIKPDGDLYQELESFTVVPCTDLHDMEMYSSRMLPFTPFPGRAAFSRELSDFCVDDLVTYTGLEIESLSQYGISLKTPTEQSWSNGDRLILCFAILNSGEKLSASIRG